MDGQVSRILKSREGHDVAGPRVDALSWTSVSPSFFLLLRWILLHLREWMVLSYGVEGDFVHC